MSRAVIDPAEAHASAPDTHAHAIGPDTPLCVDLDGTLLRGNALLESLLQLLRTRPLVLFLLPLWCLGGRAHLKQQVARRVVVDVGHWPYRRDVLDYIRRESVGGRIVALATASDRRIADAVALHLGLFAEVFASDGTSNLKGPAKARALVERFGNRGYVYVGDATSDLAVWRHAAGAVIVGAPGLAVRAARCTTVLATLDTAAPGALGSLLRLARPHQWIKNLLVMVPLVTAHRYVDTSAVLAEALALVAVCLASSAVYVINDLVDVSVDRVHPRKRLRPLASGHTGLAIALPFAIALAGGAVLVARPLPLAFHQALAAYFAGAMLYSLWLKRLVAIDVAALAGLYVMRVILGAGAIGVAASNWLMAFVALLFLGLALMKRAVELGDASRAGYEADRRRGYRAHHLGPVQRWSAVCGTLAVLVLALYAMSDEAGSYYAMPEVLLGLPLLLGWWFARAWRIARRGAMHDDPVVFVLRDPASYAVVAAMIGLMLLAI